MQYKFNIGDVVRVVELYDDDLEDFKIDVDDIGVIAGQRKLPHKRNPDQKILYRLKWFAHGDPEREMFEYQLEKVDEEAV